MGHICMETILVQFLLVFSAAPFPASQSSLRPQISRAALLASSWLAAPFTPAIAIADENLVGSGRVCAGVIRRCAGLRSRIPGTRIEDLEEPGSVTATNRGGVE